MPNRIIREGILTSDKVDLLDAAAEVFYRRLMSKVDDHGLFDGRASILRTALYPLRVDKVTEKHIEQWLSACAAAGLILRYRVDNKPYVQMLATRWQTRSDAKYPLPNDDKAEQLQTVANNCAQPLTVGHLVGDVVGDGDVVGSSELFERFFSKYPNRAGKKAALKAWEKLRLIPDDPRLQAIREGLMAAKNSREWEKDDGQYIPHASTWLNGERWNDEYTPKQAGLSGLVI